jgi:hypothetical protein
MFQFPELAEEHFQVKWSPVRVKKMRQNKSEEHFQVKRSPVRVKKMRQNKNMEPVPNSIRAGKAPWAALPIGRVRAPAGCGARLRRDAIGGTLHPVFTPAESLGAARCRDVTQAGARRRGH